MIGVDIIQCIVLIPSLMYGELLFLKTQRSVLCKNHVVGCFILKLMEKTICVFLEGQAFCVLVITLKQSTFPGETTLIGAGLMKFTSLLLTLVCICKANFLLQNTEIMLLLYWYNHETTIRWMCLYQLMFQYDSNN